MLVPRACGEPAAGPCSRCGEPRCKTHLGTGPACRGCTDRTDAPSGALVTLPANLTFDAAALEAFEVEQPGDPANAWSDLT